MKKKAQLLALGTLAFGAALLSSSPAAAAGDAKGMGEKYQLFITADRLVPLFAFTRGSSSTIDQGQEVTDSQTGSGISLLFGRNTGYEGAPINVHVVPRIAFDFTIINHLTLGAAIAFGFGLGGTNTNENIVGGGVRTSVESDAGTLTAIGLAPRVGYIIPLAEHFAFWPRAGFAFYSVSGRNDIPAQGNDPARSVSQTDTLFSIDLDPQCVVVPAQNFFFHAGPLVNIPITGTRSVETTTGPVTGSVSNDISLFHFGITAGIGGWIGF